MNSARDVCVSWFQSKNWKPLPFQEQTWSAILKQKHGLVNAATGTGKTYAVLLPIIAAHLENKDPGIKTIWICPIRALTKEIKLAAERAVEGLDSHWIVGTRTGDTPKKERDKMRVSPPEMLITTPESMHVLMAQNGFDALVGNLNYIIVDEWHELMGSKRGVQVELCISRLKGFLPKIRIWGISATIANMDEAVSVLLGNNIEETDVEIIRSDIKKEIRVNTLLPKDIFTFPWSGHIGIRMLDEAMEVLYRYKSTLIFTNTRSQCEIWYQRILEIDPSLSGKIAMHHGSIGKEIRAWVEEALYNGELKAVVCTSSLDLGVDFRPVEAIIQVGGPKGINRFIQRAGRSGHRPGIPARIYFLPTHAMELLEGSALREGINRGKLESREPYVRSFDVLIQYLMTLACGGGFHEETIFKEIKTSFSYETITREEFDWCIQFLQTGGKALTAYDEYKKAGKDRKGIIRVADKMTALRHKLGIGTIVGDQSLMIKYENGRKIGSIEEMFINKLTIGDVFWFAGRSLEIVDIKGLDVFVRNTKATKAIVPSWQGGRMPLSSQFSEMIREVIDQYKGGKIHHPEVKKLQPLLELQVKLSSIPSKEEILIEYLESSEGFHLLIYSFEGRLVHEGLGALLAWRIAQLKPISFTIAMNDYGIELLSDQPFLLSKNQLRAILSLDNLSQDLERSISQVEMARKKFREIAFISGMIFKGYPGKMKKNRYLQTSTSLLFNVFHDYDPDNLLYLQTYDEVRIFQLEEGRLQEALERIEKQEIVLKKPERATPFAIPILVDRLREILTTEKLERRIEKMKLVRDN